MLVKYYLSNTIKAPFEDFALDIQNAWAGPDLGHNLENGDANFY